MKQPSDIPPVSEEILSHPYVQHLHKVIEHLLEKDAKRDIELSNIKADLANLQKVPNAPKIKPSSLDEDKKGKKKRKGGKRAGSEKRSKKKDLPIDETIPLKATNVPTDWLLVGHKPYVIQDLIIRRNNIKYEREIWESPDGSQQIIAALPNYLSGRDFGPGIRRYVISLYNESHVTQPIIHKHLQNLGIDISTGTINFILNEDAANEIFEQELMNVVEQGFQQSEEIRVDDTGARHKGKNGYCTCVHSDLFTYFKSSSSKSRINFLSILQLKHRDYHLNEVALAYFQAQGLAPKYMTILRLNEGLILKDQAALSQYLKTLNFTAKYAVRTITEGLMIGSLVEHGFDPEKIIHSDGAGQFKLFNHALCWKHAERPFIKLRIHNDIQQKQWDKKRNDFWQLYQDLKAFKQASTLAQKRRKAKLDKRFDDLCLPVKNFEAMNNFFKELKKKKAQMLMVLNFPITSLHNNSTEGQIREFAKRRKISGSTRSDKGRKARDVFTSLKKTCKKLEINFWDYLMDRIKSTYQIPPLRDILHQKTQVVAE